tara:strand:+ start:1737 stop:3656 length:1920 start_codon:yes stop_codon:yes gene_type:complete
MPNNSSMFNGLYNSFLGAPVREVKEEYGKLKESLGSRQAEMDNAWENSSMLGGLASTAKNVTGAFGDVGGSVVSALVPDRVTEPLGEAAAYVDKKVYTPYSEAVNNSAFGEYMNNNFSSQMRVAADMLETGLNVFTGGQAKRVLSGNTINQMAGNADTKIEGFYGPNIAGKLAGVAKVGAVAVGRTIKELYTPKALAEARASGISEGAMVQTLRHLKNVQANQVFVKFDKLETQIKAEKVKLSNAKTPKGKEASEERLSVLNKEKKRQSKEIGAKGFKNRDEIEKLAKEAPSYQAGLEAYQYMLNKQGPSGEVPPIITELFGSQVMSFNTISNGGLDGVWKNAVRHNTAPASEGAKAAFKADLISAWGLGADTPNVQIMVKNPVEQHPQMGSEIGGSSTRGSPVSRFFHTVANEVDPKYFKDTQVMSDIMRLRNHSSPTSAVRDYLKFSELKASGKELSKPQQKNFDLLEAELDKLPPAKYDPVDDSWSVAGSHKSQAKELGGVHDWGSLKRDGTYTIGTSDESDMLGFKPAGGTRLITVFPPISGTLTDLMEKNMKGYDRNDPSYVDPVVRGAENIAAKRGIPVPPEGFGGLSPRQYQRMLAIVDSRAGVNATMEDYVQVAKNMVGTSALVDNKEEQE